MSELTDLVVERIKKASQSYWPPEGAQIVRIQIDLFKTDGGAFCDTKPGYRVRKVEWYEGERYKKYGLDWETGEWMLVPQGGGYPKGTFLEVRDCSARGVVRKRGHDELRRSNQNSPTRT